MAIEEINIGEMNISFNNINDIKLKTNIPDINYIIQEVCAKIDNNLLYFMISFVAFNLLFETIFLLFFNKEKHKDIYYYLLTLSNLCFSVWGAVCLYIMLKTKGII